jgi:hypothetical protein
MPVLKLPDPLDAARQEVERLNSNRDQYLYWTLERILADSPFIERGRLVEGLTAFHRERMQKIPSPVQYPESPPWVDYILAVDREVQRLANLTDEEMALYRSLHPYVMFRGFVRSAPPTVEKCRSAFIPESEVGRIHIKNVDDPITFWKPEGKPAWLSNVPEVVLESDGVGNGLHLDDEPDETFPLPARQMFRHYADDVPSSVEFLTRYSKFWSAGNLLLYDRKNRSVAIEKCSYNHMEVFYPGPDGISHISGMTCRDPKSPQGRYQRAQRLKYIQLFSQPENGPDMAFWSCCEQFEQKLSKGLRAMDRPAKLDSVVKLFTGTWPEGLKKEGLREHPDQGLVGYTLITHLNLIDRKRLMRWQRSAPPEGRFPEEPEIFDY